jgi:hypothetical protein
MTAVGSRAMFGSPQFCVDPPVPPVPDGEPSALLFEEPQAARAQARKTERHTRRKEMVMMVLEGWRSQ